MPIIEVDHVTKEYQLGQLQSLTMSSSTVSLASEVKPSRNPYPSKHWMTSVSASNPAKSWVSSATTAPARARLQVAVPHRVPTRGRIAVHGRVAPLIEVGAGLVGDMTGRENIYLNGSILGMSGAEMRRIFDEIVAFAELKSSSTRRSSATARACRSDWGLQSRSARPRKF